MSMVDRSVARRWTANAAFLDAIGHWTWFRQEMPAAIAGTGGQRIDSASLARPFLRWVSLLDAVRKFEPLDREDFAHFAAGSLLYEWLRSAAALMPDATHAARIETLTGAAVTVLDAWRTHAGAGPVQDSVPDRGSPPWASYVENCLEDPVLAVAFLDQFTGREPVWKAPLAIELRPAMAKASAARH